LPVRVAPGPANSRDAPVSVWVAALEIVIELAVFETIVDPAGIAALPNASPTTCPMNRSAVFEIAEIVVLPFVVFPVRDAAPLTLMVLPVPTACSINASIAAMPGAAADVPLN